MAHKKGQGSSRNGRDSNAQRRGVKRFGGEQVWAGNILVRQVGRAQNHGPRDVRVGWHEFPLRKLLLEERVDVHLRSEPRHPEFPVLLL